MNKNKNLTKLTLTMAAAVAATSAGLYFHHTDYNTVEQVQTVAAEAYMSSNEESLTEALNEVLQIDGSVKKIDKEETVYVFTDATGKQTSLTVSDWLKNPENASVLEDYSELTDIQNVKGEESFTDTDHKLVWNANGADIYYQGTSDQEAPVSVQYTYYLDGEEIEPKELAGKSGDVVIRIDYTNHAKVTTKVDGEKIELYRPFTVATGMILDTEHFSNVEVTNGKVLSDGSRMIVIGVAFPGMDENLKFDDLSTELSIDLPDYVEIHAKATEFECEMSLTAAVSDLFSDVDVASIEDGKDLEKKIEKKLNRLESNTSKLVDGTTELKDGVGELKNAVTGSLSSGVDELAVKSSQLKTQGIDALASGLTDTKSGAGELSKGAKQLDRYMTKLSKNTGKIADGAQTLQEAYEGEEGMLAGAKQLSEGASTVSEGVSELSNGINDMYTSLTDSIAAYEKMLSETTDPTTRAQLQGALMALQEIQSQMDDSGITSSTRMLALGAKVVADGTDTLQTGAKQLYKGTKKLNGYLEKLSDSTGELSDATGTLSTGAKRLYSGTTELEKGGRSVQSNMGLLVQGIGTLSGGKNDLVAGINDLYDGASQLDEGIQKFDEKGVQKISNLVDDDLKKVVHRLKKIKKLGDRYDSFAGIASEKTGTVKFIIKTEGIKAE